MNDPKRIAPQGSSQDEQPARRPNLTLIYCLIVLAMLAAIAFAALIVMPFYNRR